jgi:hypothetical protein
MMAIWFCEMEFNCSKQWDELTATADPMVRDCEKCGKPVHFVGSQVELEDAAAKGKCVAFYNQEKDDLPPEKRQELHQNWRINSLGGRHTLGLPRRPMSDKLKSFIDNM